MNTQKNILIFINSGMRSKFCKINPIIIYLHKNILNDIFQPKNNVCSAKKIKKILLVSVPTWFFKILDNKKKLL